MEKTLVNIIQSDRFWNDVDTIVKVLEPCLYILRLADRESPSMDLLYFYVRKMDGLSVTLKETLNLTEDKYNRQNGPNLESKIMNYFLRAKEKADTSNFLAMYDDVYDDSDEETSDDEEEQEENNLIDDMESDDDTVDEESGDAPEDNRCGSVMERSWVRRSKALRTDIAIAGWMCSPQAEVMDDCKANNKGEHRIAVTRLLRKWYSHLVRTQTMQFAYFGSIVFYSNCFLYVFFVFIYFSTPKKKKKKKWE